MAHRSHVAALSERNRDLERREPETVVEAFAVLSEGIAARIAPPKEDG